MKDLTINYYNKNASEYFNNTVSVDLSNLYGEFINLIPIRSKILDLGCGSGRDSLYFKNNGYTVTALDGSEEMVNLASKLIKQQVLHMNFENLKLDNKYNGIWACASLLHIKRSNLVSLLNYLIQFLDENGVMYMSFKYGEDEYIDDNHRYFNCYTEKSIVKLLDNIEGLYILNIFKTIDVVPNRKNIIWLNILCKKED